jgi:hypothetical protein
MGDGGDGLALLTLPIPARLNGIPRGISMCFGGDLGEVMFTRGGDCGKTGVCSIDG